MVKENMETNPTNLQVGDKVIATKRIEQTIHGKLYLFAVEDDIGTVVHTADCDKGFYPTVEFKKSGLLTDCIPSWIRKAVLVGG
jgi:hypothetical protein